MFNRWMDKNWRKIALIFFVIAYSLYHPVFRRGVIFILPLGRGIDDLIVWLALGIAGLIVLFGFFKKEIR